MAGMSKISVVSQMLLATRQGRETSLDTGGTSERAEAEYVLDTVIEDMIIKGHPSTTRSCVSHTASAAGVVTVDSLAVAVKGQGKYKGKNFTLRGSDVYDEGAGTTQVFASGESGILLDLHILLAASGSGSGNFDNLDPGFKILIRDEAVRLWRTLKMPDPFVDAQIARQQANNIEAVGGDLRVPHDFRAAPRFVAPPSGGGGNAR